VKARDAKADELEGVLFILIDDREQLLGGVELLSPLLLRRETKLHQQLRQILTLYLPHGNPLLYQNRAQKNSRRCGCFRVLLRREYLKRQ
jgi:hypothetical protein